MSTLAAALGQRGLNWLLPDWSAPSRVGALMTTRHGPRGAPLDVSTRDANDAAAAAGRAYLEQLCARPIVWLDQVHGRRAVEPNNAATRPQADALILRGTTLAGAVQTADCLPVLFCDREGTCVAAAHAGWRGLAAGILENTVATMHCPPQQILAWLGVAIGPEAFEVGDELRAAFVAFDPQAAACFRPGRPGKWFADLYALARQRLAKAGVTAVFGGGRCSFEEPENFYSHRRNQDRGRMAAVIWLESVGNDFE